MYINGKTKIIPSILSKIPPWPGINDPVFFILDNLLKKEIVKSPHKLTKEANMTKTSISNDITFLVPIPRYKLLKLVKKYLKLPHV